MFGRRGKSRLVSSSALTLLSSSELCSSDTASMDSSYADDSKEKRRQHLTSAVTIKIHIRGSEGQSALLYSVFTPTQASLR
jgi:hypothetical protein